MVKKVGVHSVTTTAPAGKFIIANKSEKNRVLTGMKHIYTAPEDGNPTMDDIREIIQHHNAAPADLDITYTIFTPMTKKTQNALLKISEEPRKTIILFYDYLHEVLPTLKSRGQIITNEYNKYADRGPSEFAEKIYNSMPTVNKHNLFNIPKYIDGTVAAHDMEAVTYRLAELYGAAGNKWAYTIIAKARQRMRIKSINKENCLVVMLLELWEEANKIDS